MGWLRVILPLKANHPISPIGMSSDQEKQWRISQLTEDEYKAFEWFKKGFTARWTTETMLLDRKTAKKLFHSLYKKLCVTNEAEVSRVYREVKLAPEDLPNEEV